MEFQHIVLQRKADEPLHLQLAGELRRYLLNHSVKCDFLPSERSLCEQLKLNRSTVHRAYETLLQDGVVRQCANKKLEVIPGARKILAGAFPSIGVLLPDKFSKYIELNNGVTLRYLNGIFDRTAELGCSTFLLQIPSPDTPEEEVKTFIESNFHKLIGIIHLGGRKNVPDPPLEMVFKYRELPQIFISGTSELPNMGSVYTDFNNAGRELAKTLLEKGCRKIGIADFIHSGAGSFNYKASERSAEMKKIFMAEGIEIDPQWDVAGKDPAETLRSIAHIYEEKKKLPDALWCVNDLLAVEVMDFFIARGIKVPEELKIAGFDGTLREGELTTIRQHRHQLGAAAVDLLWEHFENGITNHNRVKTVEASFVPGKTV